LLAYDNLLDKRGNGDRLTVSTIKMLIKNYELWGKSNQAEKYAEMLSETDANQLDVTATP
jgi:hypothetical protein